jgi:hypothetical protein
LFKQTGPLLCRRLTGIAPLVEWDDDHILFDMSIDPLISAETSFKIALKRVSRRIAKARKKEPVWLQKAA